MGGQLLVTLKYLFDSRWIKAWADTLWWTLRLWFYYSTVQQCTWTTGI